MFSGARVPGERLNVIKDLRLRLVEVSAEGLVFDNENVFPEKVDEAVVSGDFLHGRFKRGDGFAGNAEDIEEFVMEAWFARLNKNQMQKQIAHR